MSSLPILKTCNEHRIRKVYAWMFLGGNVINVRYYSVYFLKIWNQCLKGTGFLIVVGVGGWKQWGSQETYWESELRLDGGGSRHQRPEEFWITRVGWPKTVRQEDHGGNFIYLKIYIYKFQVENRQGYYMVKQHRGYNTEIPLQVKHNQKTRGLFQVAQICKDFEFFQSYVTQSAQSSSPKHI